MTDSSTKKGMGAEGSKISGGNGSECSMGILNTEHATVGNANQKSMVGSELIDILDGCMPVEEGRRIKTYIRRSLFLSLLHLYDEIFVSHFVKREDFRSFMEKVNQHYDQCYAHHEDTGDDKTQIKDGCLKAASSNYLRTSENDGLFKLKNYEASTFVVPMDQFKTALINDHIRKSDILADPKRYAGLSSLIGFLKSLRCRFESREISFLLELYELSFSRQLLLDFFYYFDLLYRQGSYFYYLKLCCEVLEIKQEINDNKRKTGFVKDFEDCFENYCKNNIPSITVKNRKDLDKFIEALNLLAEIEGESIDISRVIEFFKNIQKDQPENSKAKILLQKIS